MDNCGVKFTGFKSLRGLICFHLHTNSCIFTFLVAKTGHIMLFSQEAEKQLDVLGGNQGDGGGLLDL